MRELLVPALLALLVLVPPTVFVGLRGGLKPLRRLIRNLSDSTTALISALTDAPVRVEPSSFTRAVDHLVEQLKVGLEHERHFPATAAHELRHPLAALRLERDLARRRAEVSARTRHLQRAQHALDRMQRLVTQLLDLARVEQLTELDDVERLRLVSVAQTALRDLSARAASRSIELSLDHDGNDFVHGSRGLRGILVQNLLDNALRHAPERGQVNVRVGGTTDSVTLEVNDDGAGFSTTDPALLGERFHRPAGSLGEGSGLGLSIARAIATLHHGQLEFDRSSLGGARVRLILPQAMVAPS